MQLADGPRLPTTRLRLNTKFNDCCWPSSSANTESPQNIPQIPPSNPRLQPNMDIKSLFEVKVSPRLTELELHGETKSPRAIELGAFSVNLLVPGADHLLNLPREKPSS